MSTTTTLGVKPPIKISIAPKFGWSNSLRRKIIVDLVKLTVCFSWPPRTSRLKAGKSYFFGFIMTWIFPNFLVNLGENTCFFCCLMVQTWTSRRDNCNIASPGHLSWISFSRSSFKRIRYPMTCSSFRRVDHQRRRREIYGWKIPGKPEEPTMF